MAVVKISTLPTTAVTTGNDYFVIDDAAFTTTSKVQLKNFAGLTSDSGTDSVRSAPWLTSTDARATGDESIAIGNGASGTTQYGIAIGRNSEATSPNAIAIGNGAYNTNRDGGRDNYISIGFEAQSVQYGVSIGSRANNGGSEGVSIGRDASNNGNAGVCIGYQAVNNGGFGVSIGYGNTVNGQESDAVGRFNTVGGSYSGVLGGANTLNNSFAFMMSWAKTSVYDETAHFENVYSYGQITQAVQNFTGDTFSIDFWNGGAVDLTLTGNSTCSLTNVRPGSRYIFKVTTTGAQTLTPSASGYSFIYEGGSLSLTSNATDIVIFDVWNGGIITVSHFANFS